MKTNQPSAPGDQASVPPLSAFFDDNADPAPVRTETAYDFFGNSELLVSAVDR